MNDTAIQVHTPTTMEDDAKPSQVTYRPLMDLFETPEHYEIQLAMPGTSPEDIDVSLDGNVLNVEARVPGRYPKGARIVQEFGVGDFRRQIRLGEDIDMDQLAARYADGVLTLTLPKVSKRQAKRITITTD